MHLRRVEAWPAIVAMAAVAACGADPSEDTDTSEGAAAALAASPQAQSRIGALRERFRMTVRYDAPASAPKLQALAGPDAKPTAVIGAGIATAFEPSRIERESVRALIPPEAKRGVARTASVELPRAATGFARLEDDASHLSVRFALQDTERAPIGVADGIALYAGALAGADVVHRAHTEGTEDFVVFEEQPAREELSYTVDVSRVAGLRLVSNTLEFLDDAGSPRLRIAPPYVVDAVGERHQATLAVEGCAHDVNPAAPWGRRVTSPGAAWCTVRIAWEGVEYPAVVDPAWTATGSMAEARARHTASMLGSGKVLVAGGSGLATAELYDPATGTFSATGSMAERRYGHTASVLGSDKVLVAGPGATAELYDPATGTFSATGSMAEERGDHTASVLGSGKVLVAGGGFHSQATAELYDPAAGTFSATGSMAEERAGHTASVLGTGKVLVVSGSGRATAELYDPVAGTFSAIGSMAAVRGTHTASVLGSGNVLVVGGATAELYDPVAGTFSATGSMVEGRSGYTASVLGSGKVLVAGGGNGFGGLVTPELYDPVAGTFSATGSMAEARGSGGHTASVLESGKVLVAGGINHPPGTDSRPEVLATAELYEPPTEPQPEGGAGTSSGGTSGTTGASGSAGSASGGSSGNAASAEGGGESSGCGCRAASGAPSGAALGLALAALLGVRRRRYNRSVLSST